MIYDIHHHRNVQTGFLPLFNHLFKTKGVCGNIGDNSLHIQHNHHHWPTDVRCCRLVNYNPPKILEALKDCGGEQRNDCSRLGDNHVPAQG